METSATVPTITCPKIVETDTIQRYRDSLADNSSPNTLNTELNEIINQVVAVSSDRGVRKNTYEKLVSDRNGSKPLQNLLQLIYGREATHIYFMTKAWPLIYELNYKEQIPDDRPMHDHSKDSFFMFIMAAHYDLKLEHPAVPELHKEEMRRHHSLEPHHPEYEKLTGKECTETDILEMAVDRMSRNKQFDKANEGIERMKKYLPTYFLGDVVRKQQQYWEFVEKYMSEIDRLWDLIYGDQLNQKV